jgi:hypothetical protein
LKSIEECLNQSSSVLTKEERVKVRDWLDNEARYLYKPEEYCSLLGWWLLDDINSPISPKEAGFD